MVVRISGGVNAIKGGVNFSGGDWHPSAHYVSRKVTLSKEWALQPKDFKKILALNNKLEVDLFATSLNNKLATFLSPCPDQMATAVDAMITDWNKWNHLYLFPPMSMISKALAKLKTTRFHSAILITYNFPTRPWFMAIAKNHNPTKILSLKLQQQVGEELIIAQRTTELVVWNLSNRCIPRDTQTVIEK